MEIKKAPQADLERGKTLSLLLGLVVAISFVFVGLNWTTRINEEKIEEAPSDFNREDAIIVQDEIPEETPPEPEVQAPVAQLPEEIKIVDNSVKVETKFVSVDENKPLPPPPALTPQEPEVEDQVFEVVEKEAEYPGGPEAMLKYLSKNIEYPAIAQENGIQGRVYVEFVVEKDGTPSNFKILKSIDPALDKEALRVAKTMKKWIPGEQQGKKVRSKFRLPVYFRLNNQ